MKIATNELDHLREEVKNCHHIIKNLQKKREFVGLTDEETAELVHRYAFYELTRQIEAKLKEKNNG